jgi:ferredoxin-NADP reductase
MIQALQIGGALIVTAALLQGVLALYSQIARDFRARQADTLRLSRFRVQTEQLLRRADADRRKSELSWSGKRKFRISRKQAENKTGSICSFHLTPHDGGSLPPFEPGQFLTFELNIPGQAQPVVRCYSLSDSPEDLSHYRITVKRIGASENEDCPEGIASGFFHNRIGTGDVVDVLAPNGQFVLDTHSDRPVVLIAGGVGVTPLLSMLKYLNDNNSQRETWFVYAARNGEELACRDEIEQIISNNSHFHSLFVFSDPTEECVEGQDYDCAGRPTVELLKEHLKSSNYQFYLCGPAPMMELMTRQLCGWGIPDRDIHFEAFGPATVKTIQKDAGSGETPSESVGVKFARSGLSADWREEDGSLLDLAEAHHLKVNSGCRAGNCGTCATALKTGKVTYMATPASEPAGGTVLLCIARPDGDVTIDI